MPRTPARLKTDFSPVNFDIPVIISILDNFITNSSLSNHSSGCGVEKGTKEYEVDENYEMELLPKQQISIVVKTEKVKEIVELIKQELYTGHIGDGKIFVYDITNVIRVRTGDEGEDAL